MHLPVKAHYAALAMLAMAERFPGEVLPARVIACEHQIPAQFLGQILQQLRTAGLINATRGAGGGFHLQLDPSQIALADIVDAVCPPAMEVAIDETASQLDSILREVWEEVKMQQRHMLEQLSLADLLARRAEHNLMFYI